LLTAVVYSNSIGNGFTWDDGGNVTENSAIQKISYANLRILFTTSFLGMYVPLTMISYSIDIAIAGLNPQLFHFTNLLFHLFNIILVFYLM